MAERALFSVSRNGEPFTNLLPEKRAYVSSSMATTEAGIKATWAGDLYAVIGDADGTGGWATRFFFKPFVHWMWIGASVMVLGGVISLTDRRHRVGAPARRRKSATSTGPAPAPQMAGE